MTNKICRKKYRKKKSVRHNFCHSQFGSQKLNKIPGNIFSFHECKTKYRMANCPESNVTEPIERNSIHRGIIFSLFLLLY